MRFLLIDCGGICYDSTTCFLDRMAQALRGRGQEVTRLSVSKAGAIQELEAIYRERAFEPYDVVLDVNSILPTCREEDGSYCLSHMGRACIHYILDHPFYHDRVLSCTLENFHVIAIDKKHAEFARREYPHLSSVTFLPLAAEGSATEASASSMTEGTWRQRPVPVLFTGTYSNPDLWRYKIRQAEPAVRDLFGQIVEYTFEHPELTQEEILARVTGDDHNLPKRLQANYIADCYVHALLREELIRQVLLQDVPVTVYGNDWETFAAKAKKEIPRVGELLTPGGTVPYERMPELCAASQIVLNQSPWFLAGMHDRIPLAMVNGACCVTDGNAYVADCFTDGEELVTYSYEDMEAGARRVKELYEAPEEAHRIAARGHERALRTMTWEAWADRLLENPME